MVSVRDTIGAADPEVLAEDVVCVGAWPGGLCRGRHQVPALRDGLVSGVRADSGRKAALGAAEERPW